MVASTDRGRVAVAIPVKAFGQAKSRLAAALSDGDRARLAQKMATGVVTAAAPLPVYVVCDDREVANWAEAVGADVIWEPAANLNDAVNAALSRLRSRHEQLIIAHGDLPMARSLSPVGDFAGVTLVPDRHDEGTNVLSLPTDRGFVVAYGVGSFRRHAATARSLGIAVRVLRTPELTWDVDVPADLAGIATQPTPPFATRAGRRGRLANMLGGTMSTAPIDYGRAAPTMSSDLEVPTRALAIGAHPDDIEFGCGATLAKWASKGCIVNHLVCTDGSKGSWDPTQDRSELVVSRQHEQRAAAKALGATGDVVFLGWPDGELDSSLRQRSEVAYWIRKLRPDVVVGHDPWKRYRLHPDHRHAGLLTVEGIVAARDPHFFPEQELPHHRPNALLLYEADEADHVEEVTGFFETKLAALFAHESQFVSTMKITADDGGQERERFIARIRSRMVDAGALIGAELGEAFKAIRQL